jgi:hypothetical protein
LIFTPFFLITHPLGTNGQWGPSSPYAVKRALRSVRAGTPSLEEFKLFGGTVPAIVRLRRAKFDSTSKTSILRIGSFNVETPGPGYLTFLAKWKIDFDSDNANKKVLDTSRGAILVDIAADFDIFAIVER